MSTTSNVSAGKPPKTAGAISIASLPATLPTDATTALSGYTNLGYISEDGLTNANERTSEDIKAWGGDIVMNIQSEKTDTFSTVLIEALNVDVLKTYFGETNVSGTLSSGITITVNSDELKEQAWVVDMIMRNGALKRIVIPRGKVTSTEEIQYVDNAVTGYGITVTAFPDSSGNTHYEYIKAASST